MENFLKPLVAYFVMMDPVGTALIFNALTEGQERRYYHTMAVRSVILSAILVLFFGFWGVPLLTLLGIQMDSFRIAGGFLIFYAAFGMITRPDTGQSPPPADYFKDISVYPLTIPLIAGPGCLTLTVLLFSKARDEGTGILPLVLAILAILLLTYVSFLFSKSFARMLGQTAGGIFNRLLGVLLASLAIQFIADGIRGLWG